MQTIQTTNDLLEFIVTQANSGNRAWFGFPQQKIVGIYIAYELAKLHANTMTPEEIVDYVVKLNNVVFERLVKKPE